MPDERFPTEIKLHQKSRVMQIAFSDGRELGENREALWSAYLKKLSIAGASRE